MRPIILLAALAAALTGCSSSEGATTADDYQPISSTVVDIPASSYSNEDDNEDDSFADEEDREFNEDAAREDAESDLAAEGYNYAYGCTVDCSGHNAGWQDRANNGFARSGNSNSFDEGGRAFDEELDRRVEETRDNFEAGDDSYEY